MATQKYQRDSRHLLGQAREELAQGDVRQASEKGWGAAAQIVKAVAETRGGNTVVTNISTMPSGDCKRKPATPR